MKLTKVLLIVLISFVLNSCFDADDELSGPSGFFWDYENMDEVEEVMGQQFQSWWNATQKNYPGPAMSVMSMEFVSPYATYGMYDMARIPREEFQNDQNYTYHHIVSSPWNVLYETIAVANRALIDHNDGNFDYESDAQEWRLRSWANFIQGLSFAALANQFDQAIQIDEDTDVIDRETGQIRIPATFRDYDQLMEFATTKFESARIKAQTEDITIPAEWLGGNELDSDEFVKLINTLEARFLVQNARDWDERTELNWERIRQLAEDGIEESFYIENDGDQWWSRIHQLASDPDWVKAGYGVIGLYDESGQADEWFNSSVEERSPVEIQNPDLRIQSNADEDVDDPYITFADNPGFPGISREGYLKSHYAFNRSEMDYIRFINPSELDLYIAESILQEYEGSRQTVSNSYNYVNKTRAESGGLEELDVNSGWEKVYDAMRYEFIMETMVTAAGMHYFNTRSWGNFQEKDWGALPEGTPQHFPVPAAEMNVLDRAPYTFGGSEFMQPLPAVILESMNAASDRNSAVRR